MDMQKPKKLNYVSTERFEEISKQIHRSMGLVAQLSRSFNFSEPIPVESAPNTSVQSLNDPKFEFCEPRERHNDEQNELVKLMSGLSIRYSHKNSIQLDWSLQQGVDESKCPSKSDRSEVQFNRSLQQGVDSDAGSNDDFKTDDGKSKDTSQSYPQSVKRFSSNLNKYGNDAFQMDGNKAKTTSRQSEQFSKKSSRSTQEDVADEVSSNDGNNNLQKSESKGSSQSDQSSNRLDCSSQQDVANDESPNDKIDNLQTDACKSKNTSANDQPNKLDYKLQQNVVNELASKDVEDNFQTDANKSKDSIISVAQQDVEDNLSPNDENDNFQTHGGKSKDNSQNSQSGNQLDCSMQYDLANDVEPNNGNDNIQIDVGRSTDIDPNTQITHLDIENNAQNRPSQKQHDKQPLPFLIKHIKSITWPNQHEVTFAPVMELFGQTFETVMIHGVVTSLNVEKGGLTQRFVIDDGSDAITVVWKANKQITGQSEILVLKCKLRQ